VRRLSVLVRPSVIIATVTVLALAPANAWSGAKPVTGFPHRRTLVAYKQEGGLRFQYKALLVSAHGQAAATTGRCLAWFHLDAALWKSLKATLKQTNMHALAGDYPPPPGAADEFTYEITEGRDTVRTADGSIPKELEPLMKSLREILSAGERHMSQSCSSNQPM
jgi:emfourin